MYRCAKPTETEEAVLSEPKQQSYIPEKLSWSYPQIFLFYPRFSAAFRQPTH